MAGCASDYSPNIYANNAVQLANKVEAGTIVGSGTVANRDASVGCSCIAERRVRETIDTGKPSTPFMKFGDRIRIEMFDREGRSIFGAIDQKVVRYTPPA